MKMIVSIRLFQNVQIDPISLLKNALFFVDRSFHHAALASENHFYIAWISKY